MLTQIVYASSAARPLGDADLAEILRASRRNNADAGVTGALLYSEGNFIQVLEGPATSVAAVYRRIERDTRHHSILPLLRSTVDERQFPEWAMGFHRASTLPEEDRAAARTLFDLTEPGPSRAHRLLATFRRLARIEA